MKKHTSIYRVSLICFATAALSAGVPWQLAVADDAPSNSAPAAVTTPAAAPAPALAFGVSEVVKMYQGGIGKDVLINYIDNSVLPFHLDANGIIYLQHLGLPQEVTSALIKRDGALQQQANAAYQQQSLAYAQQPPPTAAAPNNPAAGNTAPPVVMPGTPPPVAPYPYPDAAPPVVYPDYVPAPYYGYPYYYGPDVVIGGWGWGWGWGPHGWGWGRGGWGHGGFGHGGFGGHGGGHR
ncbi:MAG: hypothetical protein ACLQU4_22135 [Limisphaerales bacterium]